MARLPLRRPPLELLVAAQREDGLRSDCRSPRRRYLELVLLAASRAAEHWTTRKCPDDGGLGDGRSQWARLGDDGSRFGHLLQG